MITYNYIYLRFSNEMITIIMKFVYDGRFRSGVISNEDTQESLAYDRVGNFHRGPFKVCQRFVLFSNLYKYPRTQALLTYLKTYTNER